MRIWSVSIFAGSALSALVVAIVSAACSGSDDSAATTTVDAGIDAANAPACPANLTLGEQVAPSQYAAGTCSTESEVCTLSETLCPGHPATFLCECEDGQWTCAIASGSYDDCITNDGGTTDDPDADVSTDDADVDAGDDDASTSDAADD